MPGETNSALVISNVTFASSEAYRLVISNVLNMATSVGPRLPWRGCLRTV